MQELKSERIKRIVLSQDEELRYVEVFDKLWDTMTQAERQAVEMFLVSSADA